MNKNLQKELFNTIKKLDGTLLTIGIEDDQVLKEINKNNKINKSYNIKQTGKKITKEQKKEGYVNVKLNKIKKKMKMSFDYILCDVNGANLYLGKAIKATYNLTNKQVILYGVYDEYDVDRIIKKYGTYNCTSVKKIYDDSFLLIIDTTNINKSKIKHFIYGVKEVISDIIEAIGNGLMQ